MHSARLLYITFPLLSKSFKMHVEDFIPRDPNVLWTVITNKHFMF